MSARILAIAIVAASAVGLVVLSMLDGRVRPGVGLALIVAVLFLGFNWMTGAARSRLERRRLRREAHSRDMHELDRTLAEFARDQAHNRLGL